MKAILTVVLALGCLGGVAGAAQMARADGGVTVRMPDVSGLDDDQAQALLTDLAKVNVITSNCPAYPVSDAEWTLIAGTGDKLAAQLGLKPETLSRALARLRCHGARSDATLVHIDDPDRLRALMTERAD